MNEPEMIAMKDEDIKHFERIDLELGLTQAELGIIKEGGTVYKQIRIGITDA